MDCQYKNIFGEERQGLHAYRLPGDFAAVDVLLTIILAMLLASNSKQFIFILILLIILSIYLHWLFCVPTTTNKILNI